jgi:hypothetical protein
MRPLQSCILGTLALVHCCATHAQAAQRSAGRPNEAHYEIRARVDDVEREDPTKMLEGSLTLRWVNRSGEAVSDLWFHLYLNAFSNNRSTHLWETLGNLRGTAIERGWGWQQVTSVKVGDVELIDTLAWQAPDTGRAEDRSVFSVQLPQPVADGAEVRVDIAWTSQLPRVRRRTGFHEDFIFLSHWFPKLGVYEAGRGWNCHEFHANTEFYSDYGTYDVTLDLPGKYAEVDQETKRTVPKVGASGMPVSGHIDTGSGRLIARFEAPSRADRERVDATARGLAEAHPVVHGFAWTADPDYVIKKTTFHFDDWAAQYPLEVSEAMRALDKSREEIALRDVEVLVLIQPEREEQWERHARATEAALFFYGLWWGEYPYERLTVVDPAWGARAAGGMEYPTLFTCGTRLFAQAEMHTPESVTVHEAGHQFWYGLVGNNEFEAAWMDEGFNSYTDSEVMQRVYGPRRSATWYAGLPEWGRRPTSLPAGGRLGDALTARRWDLPGRYELQPLAPSAFLDWWRDQPKLTFVEEYSDPRWGDRAGYLADPETDPIATIAFHYCDRASYRTNSYPRTAAALRSLAGVVGKEAFLRGMRNHAETWRYRHPYPEDFYAAFIEGAETDVTWYFEEVFEGTGTVDWRVDVAQPTEPKPRGWFLGEQGFVEHREPEAEPEAPPGPDGGDDDAQQDSDGQVEPPDTPPEAEKLLRHYDVVVRRKGTLRLPLAILVTFEAGEDEPVREERFTWSRAAQAESKWWRLPLEPGTARIISVVVDPERLYYLDGDMSDNQWYAEADPVAPLRWSERVFTQTAHLLHWFSAVGG